MKASNWMTSQPHSDITSLILIFPASFWYFQPLSYFSFFLLTQWHLLTFFSLISFFFKEATKITALPLDFFPLSSETDFNFLKTTISTIMSTSTLVGSCTDSIPSVHIRWAILTDISWNKFKNHMVSTWKPHGIYIETIWCPPGNHVVTTLCQHGNHMVSIWKPCFVNIETMWFLYGNHMVSTFDTLWWPPGNHMVCTWKPYGVCLGTMWCPCGNYVVST